MLLIFDLSTGMPAGGGTKELSYIDTTTNWNLQVTTQPGAEEDTGLCCYSKSWLPFRR